ncbi:adhesion G-protein coupled receptor D1-like [Hyalella azteca]|uniref:Adhesion G-protein coupled receptor D1-like n=1 Tax=Hyalella azteca TaxID=294128 RepID=A0A8B7N9K5_HYAAZ|nr:adhesion G-protein coupled receptor D1-like [Hyalella azteca]
MNSYLLPDVNSQQMMSAKFSQRTNLLLLPLVYFHWLLGVMSEYQQNLALYSIFSILNSVLGVLVMVFHCSNNEKVRNRMKDIWSKIRGKKTNTKPLTTVSPPPNP